MSKLANQVALITGASRGIGAGIATAFAREGAKVILVARDELRLKQLESSLRVYGVETLVLPVDVTQENQVINCFQQVREKFGRLDLLINNAGVFDGGPLDEMTLETWEKVMSVNLKGPFLCTREAMKIMKPQRGGRIINIGSISAQRVRMNSAAYSTSKHGIWGLTQVTALEGRAFGITCGCLHPGNVAVETLIQVQKANQEPAMQPSEIAEAAVAMAAMPSHIAFLEAIVLPTEQAYLGRG